MEDTYAEALDKVKNENGTRENIAYLEKMAKFERIGILLGAKMESAMDVGRAFFDKYKRYSKRDVGTFQISLQVSSGLSYKESVEVADLVIGVSI